MYDVLRVASEDNSFERYSFGLKCWKPIKPEDIHRCDFIRIKNKQGAYLTELDGGIQFYVLEIDHNPTHLLPTFIFEVISSPKHLPERSETDDHK